MIHRLLTKEQKETLIILAERCGIGALALRRYQIAYGTVALLVREKLAYLGDDALYRVTRAGRLSLVEGKYLKQPQQLIFRKATIKGVVRKPAPTHVSQAGRVMISHAGITQSIEAWSVQTGISELTLMSRYNHGWTHEMILSINGEPYEPSK